MSGRLSLVLVVALSIAHHNPAQSALLNASSGDLAYRALRVLERHNATNGYGAADGEAMDLPVADFAASLSRDAFEHAASHGLASLATVRRPLTLEETIALASLGGGLFSSSNDTAATQPSDDPGVTLRDLAHLVVNRPESSPNGSQAQQPAPRQRRGGFSLFNAIMATQLNAQFIETAAEVVTPTVTMDGLIALSFLGLRDFAFVVSPLTNRIQVMDFETGTMVTLSRRGYEQALQPESFSSPQQEVPQRRATAPTLTVQMVLAYAKRFISTYVLHPFTVGSMALFSIFWIVLRIGRRAD